MKPSREEVTARAHLVYISKNFAKGRKVMSTMSPRGHHYPHPTFHICIPSTLLPQIERNTNEGNIRCSHFQVFGFFERSLNMTKGGKKTNPFSEEEEGCIGDGDTDRDKPPEVIQVSLTALRPGGLIHPQGKGRGQRQRIDAVEEDSPVLLGELLLDQSPLRAPPQSYIINEDSLFISFRLKEDREFPARSYLLVERVVLDTETLPPDPRALLIFTYDPHSLRDAVALRKLPPEESGLPPILTRSRKLPTKDLIPLLPEENAENKVDEEEETLKDPSSDDKESNFLLAVVKRSFGLQHFVKRLELIFKLAARRLPLLQSMNLITLLLLDSLFGLMGTAFLLQYPILYPALHKQAHFLLRALIALLDWLKGSPAGLKLNGPLNSLLWRFFSYHLHLWGNYIGILEPILSLMLSSIIYSGPFGGLSLQIALAKDLLSIATFHMHCLYIYATRSYRVLMVTITALGRLFWGRKWNPLRERIDHVHLSPTEMFLSSILFTVGVFLAPTVIVYYVVFVFLRLPVFLTEWLLVFLVKTFNSLTLFTSHLVLGNHPSLCDQVYLEEEGEKGPSASRTHSHSHPEGPLQFRIKLQSTRSFSPLQFPPITTKLNQTVSNMVKGHALNLDE